MLTQPAKIPPAAKPQLPEAIRTAPHAKPVDEIIRVLQTDPQHGLSPERARELLAVYGPNELAQKPPMPRWKMLLEQFDDLIIWLLIAAAVISAVAGEWVDALVILAIVILNGILGFIQEDRATRAMLSLQKLATPHARAIRGGQLVQIPARELVPGDLVEVEAGDQAPADVRLVQATNLRVVEAALTGESVPVEKDHAAVLDESAPLAERRNMIFMGTSVATGKAFGIVVATAMNTQIGQIVGLIESHRPEPTPLQRRLKELGKTLLLVVVVAVVVIFVLQLLRGGRPVQTFLLAVSLAVAAVPEGLPAVVTIALAIGLQRMIKRNVLIRKLPSVETLGSVTVICSDKTGTLTRNEMTVAEVIVGSGRYQITGAGYEPVGEIRKLDGSQGEPVDPQKQPDLWRALIIGAVCNQARVFQEGGRWREVGDPTEAALVVAALKAKVPGANEPHQFVREIPFDSDRKMMSVVVDQGGEGLMMYTKGAPEALLSRCAQELVGDQMRALAEERRREILQTSQQMAERALRVLAVAFRKLNPGEQQAEEKDLVFAGLFGMIDPPRQEAKVAVQKCHQAGIRPVMITGDHPATARAIAAQLGIAKEGDEVISGAQLDAIADDALAGRAAKIAVYARVTAEHKMRVVRALKAQRQIVAMTGDGVNDAPAIKAADIGIAMGITGTDVTKEAAAMVLLDDNFASIVAAVEEGRGIYDNIRKFIHYLLSSNTSEILLMLAATLVGWPAPLLAIHILWINLVTDSFPALALGLEKPEPDIMSRPPRPADEPVITRKRGMMILLHGLLLSAAALAGYLWTFDRARGPESLRTAQTVAFSTLALTQLFFSVSCRSSRWTLPQLGAFSNLYVIGAMALGVVLQLAIVSIPPLRTIFKLVPLSAPQWGVVFMLALIPVTVIEVGKIITSRRRAARTGGEQPAAGLTARTT